MDFIKPSVCFVEVAAASDVLAVVVTGKAVAGGMLGVKDVAVVDGTAVETMGIIV